MCCGELGPAHTDLQGTHGQAVHVFPIGHSGNSHTTEIGKHYKLGLFIPPSRELAYQHTARKALLHFLDNNIFACLQKKKLSLTLLAVFPSRLI